MRILGTVLAVIAVLTVAIPLILLAALVLAGPHSDVLPSWLQGAVLSVGWLITVAVAFLVGRGVWQRMNRADGHR